MQNYTNDYYEKKEKKNEWQRINEKKEKPTEQITKTKKKTMNNKKTKENRETERRNTRKDVLLEHPLVDLHPR